MKKVIKATVSNIIVALFIFIFTIGGIFLCLGRDIKNNISLIDKITVVEAENKEEKVIEVDKITNYLSSYPSYGEKYATLEIDKIDLNKDVYFGDTYEILKNGVGHNAGSYFPSEGGSIVYLGHNTPDMFRRFSELEIGDIITVKTSYGTFNYKIYDMKVINETEKDKLPIQREEEILMIYTCYPFNALGHTTNRYVVYSKLVSGEEA